jgi:predicted PurR-regulated permease PerM
MKPGEHIRLTTGALKNWFIAQCQDSLAVGILWFLGLHFIKVPLAPLWAIIAAILQFVPHLGPVLELVGPVLAAAISKHDWQHPFYVLLMYAGIALVDGLLLQPYLMKRTVKVPMWASILGANRFRFSHSVLGCIVSSTIAGRCVCVSRAVR